MSADEIVWEDPPEAPRGKNGRWIERLTPLLDHPGRWARWEAKNDDTASVTAGNLRRRKLLMPPGRFEIVRRSSAIYVRYLGEDES